MRPETVEPVVEDRSASGMIDFDEFFGWLRCNNGDGLRGGDRTVEVLDDLFESATSEANR